MRLELWYFNPKSPLARIGNVLAPPSLAIRFSMDEGDEKQTGEGWGEEGVRATKASQSNIEQISVPVENSGGSLVGKVQRSPRIIKK